MQGPHGLIQYIFSLPIVPSKLQRGPCVPRLEFGSTPAYQSHISTYALTTLQKEAELNHWSSGSSMKSLDEWGWGVHTGNAKSITSCASGQQKLESICSVPCGRPAFWSWSPWVYKGWWDIFSVLGEMGREALWPTINKPILPNKQISTESSCMSCSCLLSASGHENGIAERGRILTVCTTLTQNTRSSADVIWDISIDFNNSIVIYCCWPNEANKNVSQWHGERKKVYRHIRMHKLRDTMRRLRRKTLPVMDIGQSSRASSSAAMH